MWDGFARLRWPAAAGFAVYVGGTNAWNHLPMSESAEPPGLRIRAETRVSGVPPVTLRTTITLTNRGADRVELMVSRYCPVGLRAYRTVRGQTTPDWDSSRLICVGAGQSFGLAPGESRRLARVTRATEILGDSLPAGRYRLVAVLNAVPTRSEVPAGYARLARRAK
jgi:hypothetical protein